MSDNNILLQIVNLRYLSMEYSLTAWRYVVTMSYLLRQVGQFTLFAFGSLLLQNQNRNISSMFQ